MPANRRIGHDLSFPLVLLISQDRLLSSGQVEQNRLVMSVLLAFVDWIKVIKMHVILCAF